jgi:hypothetical protein
MAIYHSGVRKYFVTTAMKRTHVSLSHSTISLMNFCLKQHSFLHSILIFSVQHNLNVHNLSLPKQHNHLTRR